MAAGKGSVAKRVLIVIAIVLVALIGVAAWYVNDYYHADDVALAVVADADGEADGVEVRELSNGAIALVPQDPLAGLIFYPGAKVQPEAYTPLMQQCAEQGVLCVIVKPLFNLAIIDMNAADGVVEQFPEVDTWLLAGHSMGGVAAADYVLHHEDGFDGVVFFASYPAADLSQYGGNVLSIVGSNDGVLNREKYDEARAMLPAGASETIIEGGNHAYFGNYGEQAGDGIATISRDVQQEQVVEAVVALAKGRG